KTDRYAVHIKKHWTARAKSVIIATRVRKSLPEAVSEINVVPNLSVIAGGTNGRSSRYHSNEEYGFCSGTGPARFDDDCCRIHDRFRHFYCVRWNFETSRFAGLAAGG